MHFVLIPLSIVLSIILPLNIFLLGLLAWTGQSVVFKGCVITNIQRKRNTLFEDMGFTQDFMYRFFRKKISSTFPKVFYKVLFVVLLVLSIVSNF